MCLFVPVVGLLSFNPFELTLSLFFHHLHKIPLLRIVISFTLLSRLGKSLHSMWSYVCVMLRNKCGVNWCKLCVPKPIKKNIYIFDPETKEKKEYMKIGSKQNKRKGRHTTKESVLNLEFVCIWRSKVVICDLCSCSWCFEELRMTYGSNKMKFGPWSEDIRRIELC